MIAPPEEKKSSRPSHYDLTEGDLDPELNKVVRTIILVTYDFIVYLDSDLDVQWHFVDDYEPPEYFGDVSGDATILETRSSFIKDKKKLSDVRRLIAEAIAQCLHKQPQSVSSLLLAAAEQKVQVRNRESSWLWYFGCAGSLSLVCIFLIFILWIFRLCFVTYLGNTGFEVVLGALCGPVGALLSAGSRANRLVMDANAGPSLHVLEGLSRVVVGLVGASLLALAIKGGLIMGGLTFNASPLALMLALCMAAGASERLVPSLIVAFDKLAGTQEVERLQDFHTRTA